MDQNNLQVRLIRETTFYWIDKSVYKKFARSIGVIGLALYNAYAFYSDQKTQMTFVSIRTLAKDFGLSTKTICKYNKILIDHNLIKIDHQVRGKSNQIYLTDVSTGYQQESRHKNTKNNSVVSRKTGCSIQENTGVVSRKTYQDPIIKNNISREEAKKFLATIKERTGKDLTRINIDPKRSEPTPDQVNLAKEQTKKFIQVNNITGKKTIDHIFDSFLKKAVNL